MAVFIRLIDAVDKAETLRSVVQNNSAGLRYEVQTHEFRQIPGSPFAYWLTDKIRALYTEFPKFECKGIRSVRLGVSTKNDSRFVRLWFEILDPGQGWSTYANGSRFGRFFQDYFAIIRTGDSFKELSAYLVDKFPYLKGNAGWILHLENDYSLPAIGWPLRTHSFSPHVLPTRTVFSARTYAVYVPENEREKIAAFLTSKCVDFLLKVMLGRSGHPEFVTAVVRALPWIEESLPEVLSDLFRAGWSISRSTALFDETSRHFLVPRILGNRLPELSAYLLPPDVAERALASIVDQIDDIAFDYYGLKGNERNLVKSFLGETLSLDYDSEADAEEEYERDLLRTGEELNTPAELSINSFLSWCMGVIFGRFDIRVVTGERAIAVPMNSFAPFPTRSPGMVPIDEDSSVWAHNILVDDPGHNDDLSALVQEVLQRLKLSDTSSVTPELYGKWFSREYFQFHIKMYTKNHRKAPIYWQLSTPTASYSIWLYVHSFSRDTIYQVQNDYVVPKLIHEERKLEELSREAGLSPSAVERKQITAQKTFVVELRAFLEEVRRVAPLWNPDLDDGVIINFAPLWRLVPQNKAWQRELKSVWDDLCTGKYDWAHLAMHLWPERVLPKCAKDRSLAIAHGLEDRFWVQGDDGKHIPRMVSPKEQADMVRERTAPAVKAALESLLTANGSLASASRPRRRS